MPVTLLASLAVLLAQRATAAPIDSAPLQERATAAPVDVVQQNFPDPGLFLDSDGTWYSYATRTIGTTINIPVAKSSDWSSWSVVTDSSGRNYDALPTMPSWVDSTPNAWAPDVQKLVSLLERRNADHS